MHRDLSRREWLELVLAAGVAASTPFADLVAQQPLPETPNMVLGPFYPEVKPADQDGDLTRLRGHRGRASGQVLHLSGRVLNRRGDPVRNARVEIWQTNRRGRYAHPSDPNTDAPLDADFQGFGVQRTDANGFYRFTTIKPGAYPERDGRGMRTPHIHFDVQGRVDRKITQMFFPGEPLNEKDRLFQQVPRNRDGLLARVESSGDELLVTWDIVLATG